MGYKFYVEACALYARITRIISAGDVTVVGGIREVVDMGGMNHQPTH